MSCICKTSNDMKSDEKRVSAKTISCEIGMISGTVPHSLAFQATHPFVVCEKKRGSVRLWRANCWGGGIRVKIVQPLTPNKCAGYLLNWFWVLSGAHLILVVFMWLFLSPAVLILFHCTLIRPALLQVRMHCSGRRMLVLPRLRVSQDSTITRVSWQCVKGNGVRFVSGIF